MPFSYSQLMLTGCIDSMYTYMQVEKKMLMFVLNPLRHIGNNNNTLIIFLKMNHRESMDRDSLQCILTGAILVDQVGNVDNTCYNTCFSSRST